MSALRVGSSPRFDGVSEMPEEFRARNRVPRFMNWALCLMLIGAGVISAPVLGRGGPLPVTTMLDVWIVLLTIYLLFRTTIRTSGVLLLLIAYGLTRVIPAAVIGAPMYDFLQAYRWVFYLVVLALAVGKTWGVVKPLIVMTWVLMILAIVKGIITQATLGLRPGLLLENNFEIPLFAGIVALIYPHLRKSRLPIILTMGLLTVVAGSRSGVLAFVVLAMYAFVQVKRGNILLRYLAFLALPIAGWVAYDLFEDRAAGERRLDRLNFLNVFLREMESADILTWIFGSVPITPLSLGACSSLSDYSGLYSTAGDGSCYSVILHAFFLRVVFDAGILGAVLCFGLMWYLMWRAKVPTALIITLLGIAAVNSTSVSGPNNPYVMLPVLFAILGVFRTPEEQERVAFDSTDERDASPLARTRT